MLRRVARGGRALARAGLQSRFCALTLLSAVSLHAAILPEKFGPHTRGALSTPAPADPALWAEYGFKAAEQAVYSGPRSFTITASRFADPTGAAAAFDAERPDGARASRVANLAVMYPNGELVVFGNYLIRIDGWQPAATDLAGLVQALPDVSRASLPLVRAYLPERGLDANSRRYILGPVSLARFAPHIPARAAGFDRFGAEAAVAHYRTAGGEVALAIFMYPTPHMTRENIGAFQQIPTATAKRTGPMIAIVTRAVPGAPMSTAQVQAAERLLKAVEYRPEFTWTERVPKDENVGKMMMAIFSLAGVLIAAAFGFGLLFAAYRVYGKKFGIGPADDSFTALHLGGK